MAVDRRYNKRVAGRMRGGTGGGVEVGVGRVGKVGCCAPQKQGNLRGAPPDTWHLKVGDERGKGQREVSTNNNQGKYKYTPRDTVKNS